MAFEVYTADVDVPTTARMMPSHTMMFVSLAVRLVIIVFSPNVRVQTEARFGADSLEPLVRRVLLVKNLSILLHILKETTGLHQ